jgi:hypothetical protein
LLFIGSGILLAFLITKLIRRLSSSKGSWQELARNFPAPPGEITGEKFSRQTIAVGPVIYKNCVLESAAVFKKNLTLPLILVGGIRSFGVAEFFGCSPAGLSL